MVQIQAPVVSLRQCPEAFSILTVDAPVIARSVKPGQFVMAALAQESMLPSPLLKRALAVYRVSDPTAAEKRGGHLTLLLKIVGEGTLRLASARPGDRLELVGPLGNGFDLAKGKGKVNLIVAGGTGIASVLLLAESLARGGEEVHLVYGGRSSEDLVGIDDFGALGIPIQAATEDGSQGYRGLATQALEHYLGRFPAPLCNIYTCGPTPMMQAVARLAKALSIPCQISVEVKMGCGFGVCLGCTVLTREGFKLACSQGPVFEADEFVWEGERWRD